MERVYGMAGESVILTLRAQKTGPSFAALSQDDSNNE
jgi:hypothetical protein